VNVLFIINALVANSVLDW